MTQNIKGFRNIETEKVEKMLVHSTIDRNLSKMFNETIYQVDGGYLIKRDFYSQFFTKKESLINYLEKVKKLEIEQNKELNFQRDNFDDLFYQNFIEISDSFVASFDFREQNIVELDKNLSSISKNQRKNYKKQITAYLGKLIIENNTNSKWLKFQNPAKNQFISASIVLNGTNQGKIVDVYQIVIKELEKDSVQFVKNQILRTILK
jgi:hypothetical protein